MDELERRLTRDAEPGPLPAGLWERVDAEISAGDAHDRLVSLPSWLRLGIGAAVALGVGGLLIGVQGVRGDLDAAGWARFALASLPLGIATVSGLALSVRSRGASALPYGALAAGIGGVVLLGALLAFPGMTGVPMAAHLHCGLATSLATATITACFAMLERDRRPAPARVALAAVGGGAWAFVAQSVFCPGVDVAHLLLGHGTSAVLVALLGAGLALLNRRR